MRRTPWYTRTTQVSDLTTSEEGRCVGPKQGQGDTFVGNEKRVLTGVVHEKWYSQIRTTRYLHRWREDPEVVA